jgi:hypothetical protein
MPIDGLTLRKYINPYFIETGSGRGRGIKKALIAGFPNIISIEIDPTLATKLQQYFIDVPNVTIINGDSTKILKDVIKDIDDHITFWLDAHYPEPYEKREDCALLHELDQIEYHVKHVPLILIDDRKYFEKHFRITEQEVRSKLLNIWQNFSIQYDNGPHPSYKDNIIVALPK